MWAGSYYVVEWETLRRKPSAKPSQCRIYEVEEIFNFNPASIRFPLAEYREELQLRVCSSSDEEPNPVTTAIPDVLPFPVEGGKPQPAVTAGPEQSGSVDSAVPVKFTDSAVTPRSPSAAEADPLAPDSKKDGEEDMAWLVGAENVGVPEDRRGKGETQITGRKVRKYVGSKRPPGIDPKFGSRS